MASELHLSVYLEVSGPWEYSDEPKKWSALIPGAGSGIGREVGRVLCKKGWTIAALDQNETGLRASEREYEQEGRVYGWVQADVTDASAVERAVKSLESRFGTIDLLVACAGISD